MLSELLGAIVGYKVLCHCLDKPERSEDRVPTDRATKQYVRSYVDECIATNTLYPLGGIGERHYPLAAALNVEPIVAYKLIATELTRRNISVFSPEEQKKYNLST